MKRGRIQKGRNFMIADKMKNLVKNSSAIRAMFEEGKKMAQESGEEEEEE